MRLVLWLKMCHCTCTFHIYNKLDFTQNVTYDLLAFTRRFNMRLRYDEVCAVPIWSMFQKDTFFRAVHDANLKHVSGWHMFWERHATPVLPVFHMKAPENVCLFADSKCFCGRIPISWESGFCYPILVFQNLDIFRRLNMLKRV